MTKTDDCGVYRAILTSAARRFDDRVHPIMADYLDEELGLGFHLSVEVLADFIRDKWPEAIDTLAKAVLTQGGERARRIFHQLDLPSAVTFAERAGAVRFIVQYVPPAIDETGRSVPGYNGGRFDVAGNTYRTGLKP